MKYDNDKIQNTLPMEVWVALTRSSWAKEGRDLADTINCISLDVEDMGQAGLPSGLTMAGLAMAKKARAAAAVQPTATDAAAAAEQAAADAARIAALNAASAVRSAEQAETDARNAAWDRLHRLVSGLQIGCYFHNRGIRPAPGREGYRQESWRANYDIDPALAGLTTAQVNELCDRIESTDWVGSGYHSQSVPELALEMFPPAPTPEPAPEPEPELTPAEQATQAVVTAARKLQWNGSDRPVTAGKLDPAIADWSPERLQALADHLLGLNRYGLHQWSVVRPKFEAANP